MSIVRQLIQIALVEAQRDRTIAGPNVFDSRMDTLDGFMAGAEQPVLIFSIEESEAKAGLATDGFIGRDVALTAMVQMAVASGREVRDGEGAVILPSIGESDSAYEASLNLLDRQWRQVLHDSDNAWARLFRDLIVSVGDIKDTRATDPETGRKHAARFTQFSLRVMPDPLPGNDLPEAIEAGLTLLETDGDIGYATLASSWRGQLATDPALPDWRKLQSVLFATNGDMVAMGLAEDDAGVPFNRAEISVSGVSPVVIENDP